MFHSRLCVAFLAATLFSSSVSAQTQVLGPWEVASPDTATLIAGGGSGWNWLNVVNTPTSIQDAFTGLPCDTRGYANGPFGTTVEVVFNSGVTNSAGPDLLMLDAFGGGQYLIASDHDSFVATHALSHAGAAVIATHDFWYGQNTTGGSFSADVTGVEVDLTDLGVPQGATVYALRFIENGGGSDPIGLVKLAGGPTLSFSGSFPGPGTVEVTNATPGGPVAIGWSTSSGSYILPVSSCAGITLGILGPQVLFSGVADANGEFSVVVVAPPNACGAVFLQGLGRSTCVVTNVLAI